MLKKMQFIRAGNFRCLFKCLWSLKPANFQHNEDNGLLFVVAAFPLSAVFQADEFLGKMTGRLYTEQVDAKTTFDCSAENRRFDPV